MDNATFHQREAILATVRNVIADLVDACEVQYQKGYTLAYTQAKRDDMATLRAFNKALLAGEYDNPAITAGIETMAIRGVSEDFMKDVYSFLGMDVAPEDAVEWNDELSIADNIKANIIPAQASLPEGYIIRNDGFFGEWSLWLDDELGTIIGDGSGYASKQDAISAAWKHKENNSMLAPKGYTITGLLDTDYRIRRWVYDTPEGIISDGLYESKDAAVKAARQHKENQSKGDTVKATISIYDAKTSDEFVQGAKNLAYDIANQQGFSDIVDALLNDEIESISEVFQQCWDNYTCYSPFEVVMAAINKLGEDESAECWDSIQDAIQEVFESVAAEVLQGVKDELHDRVIDAEDAFTIDDEQIDDMLDSSQDAFMIGDMEFMPSDILKSCDPIAYNEVKAEQISFMIDEDEEIQALNDLRDNVTI